MIQAKEDIEIRSKLGVIFYPSFFSLSYSLYFSHFLNSNMNPTTIITFSVQEDSRLFLPHSAKDDAGYKVSIESEPPVAMGNKM